LLPATRTACRAVSPSLLASLRAHIIKACPSSLHCDALHCDAPGWTDAGPGGAGGGSKADYHVEAAERGDLRMFHQGSGFVACELTPRSLGCQFHGIAGAGVFHTASISL